MPRPTPVERRHHRVARHSCGHQGGERAAAARRGCGVRRVRSSRRRTCPIARSGPGEGPLCLDAGQALPVGAELGVHVDHVAECLVHRDPLVAEVRLATPAQLEHGLGDQRDRCVPSGADPPVVVLGVTAGDGLLDGPDRAQEGLAPHQHRAHVGLGDPGADEVLDPGSRTGAGSWMTRSGVTTSIAQPTVGAPVRSIRSSCSRAFAGFHRSSSSQKPTTGAEAASTPAVAAAGQAGGAVVRHHANRSRGRRRSRGRVRGLLVEHHHRLDDRVAVLVADRRDRLAERLGSAVRRDDSSQVGRGHGGPAYPAVWPQSYPHAGDVSDVAAGGGTGRGGRHFAATARTSSGRRRRSSTAPPRGAAMPPGPRRPRSRCDRARAPAAFQLGRHVERRVAVRGARRIRRGDDRAVLAHDGQVDAVERRLRRRARRRRRTSPGRSARTAGPSRAASRSLLSCCDDACRVADRRHAPRRSIRCPAPPVCPCGGGRSGAGRRQRRAHHRGRRRRAGAVSPIAAASTSASTIPPSSPATSQIAACAAVRSCRSVWGCPRPPERVRRARRAPRWCRPGRATGLRRRHPRGPGRRVGSMEGCPAAARSSKEP